MSEEIKTEPYESRVKRWFAGHQEGCRSRKVPKPEIDEVAGRDILYRSSGYKVLGEVVRGPYEEEGVEKVDYRPLPSRTEKGIGMILREEEEKLKSEIENLEEELKELSRLLEEEVSLND